MGDRHDAVLRTAVPEPPSESRRQRAVLDPTRPRGRFDERRAQPAVALAHLAGSVLPGTLIVTRTEGGPAREATRTGKRAHIHANLRDDDLRGALIDPWNAVQPRQRVGKRGDHRLHLSAQNPNAFVQIVEVRGALTAARSGTRGAPESVRRALAATPAVRRATVRGPARPASRDRSCPARAPPAWRVLRSRGRHWPPTPI